MWMNGDFPLIVSQMDLVVRFHLLCFMWMIVNLPSLPPSLPPSLRWLQN